MLATIFFRMGTKPKSSIRLTCCKWRSVRYICPYIYKLFWCIKELYRNSIIFSFRRREKTCWWFQHKMGDQGSIMESNATKFNDTIQEVDEDYFEDLAILMEIVPFLVPILFSLIIITGFIGNILVVCVIIKNKNMMNTTNLLILNLAVSNQPQITIDTFSSAGLSLKIMAKIISIELNRIRFLVFSKIFLKNN